ncbi:hypothetical protein BATDEDRAFT_11697 [Batrachochytrium dendrobatidis JAM81]|uniref:UBA domain-containing protein n=1 Tax=Batrachochytrium dendrobatidis (strain JAM81 / FGSC 10211) TaxID=684364 RepID=F4P3V2_BATDJ|nr:uncharacterized protein BATDEDRAFT_11697 [Batrachochytrium dendrobatidis JAM81]EGF80285.1 hypothetical protein BATDEDRAFT_11697 [Batrachochytrium dendrobatidis JAM81]|eukprot:XP_006678885.1 hypothetical protein BATDEDRAFT_11697 [Batrachochytrium dendrobatidis JAM81]
MLTSRFNPIRLVLSSSAEVLFGSILIYQFRLLERQWGSAKFAAFFTLSSLISTCTSLAFLVLFRPSVDRIALGPFGFIAASTVLYSVQVPASYYFKLFGIGWSDHSFIYILAMQLAFISSPLSIFAWVGGIIAGGIYTTNTGNIKQWRFPTWIRSIVSSYILPLLESSHGDSSNDGSNPLSTATTPADQRRSTSTLSSHNASEVIADPHLVETLTGMGFEREASIAVLVQARNNLDTAIVMLVEHT